MKNCAVLCEYNPFHTGHAYQLGAIRAAGADNILCVMSGAFVQSALPAFCDKSIRTRSALLYGADAVIELPVVYSTAGAQFFAEGYIKIASEIKELTHIAMGATYDGSVLERIADIKYSQSFTDELKRRLSDGISYNTASVNAICSMYAAKYSEEDVSEAMKDPNNMLCVEYICAAKKLAPHISPLIIRRRGAAYGDMTENAEHISATAIRNAFERGESAKIKRYLPDYDRYYDYARSHSPNIEMFKSMAVYAIRKADIRFISKLRDCSEGLEYLVKNVPETYSYDAYTDALCSKRYGKKRIARLFLDALLEITRDMTELDFCTRLLGCKKNFDFSILPSRVKTDNASIVTAAKSNAGIERVLKADIDATALYNTLCRIDGSYFNYSLIKV